MKIYLSGDRIERVAKALAPHLLTARPELEDEDRAYEEIYWRLPKLIEEMIDDMLGSPDLPVAFGANLTIMTNRNLRWAWENLKFDLGCNSANEKRTVSDDTVTA